MRMTKSAFGALSMTMWMLVAASGPLAAQEGEASVEPVADDAISKIRSPFCPGLMLEVCPTASAAALRDTIHSLAAEGIEADSLVELIVAQYGEEYRAYPKRSGAGLWAWVMPPTALLIGLGLVVVALRRMKEPEGTQVGELSDEERRRLDEALALMDGDEP